MERSERRAATTMVTVLAGAACALCAACAAPGRVDGVGDTEYRTIFTQVIDRTLGDQVKDNVCITGLSFANPAIDVFVDIDPHTAQAPQGRLGQLRALEAVGLVTHTDGVRDMNGRTQRIATFRTTDKATPYLDDHVLCYAHATLDRVVKWKGPIALGDYRAAFVYYTTKIGPLADWSRASEVVAAFPTVAANLDGRPSKERQVVIDKSNVGWDVAEYSKLLKLD